MDHQKKRVKENFDADWFFHKGDLPVKYAVKAGMTGGITDNGKREDGEWIEIAYTDKETGEIPIPKDWNRVQIPHDWVVEGNVVNDPDLGSRPGSHGYLPTGIGFYRKMFAIQTEDLGKKLSIHFDGVMGVSTVWLNGHLLGTHNSGYIGVHYDISDIIRYGEEGNNVIVVKVDANRYEGWWYEGGGIYRHTWLQKTDRLHVGHWGTYVTTPHVTDESAEVMIRTIVHNEYEGDRLCELKSTLVDNEGKFVASVTDSLTAGWFIQKEVEQFVSIPVPQLWSPDRPYLYKLVTEIAAEGVIMDTYETTFGVRTLAFTRNGFALNGKPTLLKGTCNHQDFAGVGVALPDRIIAYKLQLLKEMGCNAYRSAHHPPTPELLDICDRLGMMVIDENRKLDGSPEGIADLKSLIYRDRNHPSIILWCMENEEILEGKVTGARILRTLATTTRKLDATRPTLAAMNHGWNGEGYSDQVDIVGYNYGQRKLQDVTDHQAYLSRIMLGSESASSTTTRGIYVLDKEKGYCPAYEGVFMPSWSCTVEKAWNDLLAHPFLTGVFLWTGFDYRGEPSPYRWPCVNSHFGIMDTCGFPKDVYFYLKSVWTEEPMVHFLPHWNWHGQENELIDVWIYSNGDSVELSLNGRSLGTMPMIEAGHLEWKVPYEPGVIIARAYKEGVAVAVKQVETTGTPYTIQLQPDRTVLHADSTDVAFITVTIRDEQGHVVPISDNEVSFVVEGEATILGVGNGNPSSHEPDKANRRRAFNGYCLLMIQTHSQAGEIVVRGISVGLLSAELRLRSC
ncbi:glycoside hydrolase family 2 protein [Paenibacillus sp. SYP-B3998]|uniref:Glycoside hydrolase family 2 protein n=1 Tax=Paenibacillus sp. SYP-B3998 TaxID=2678564 RepID=A0A6G3ZVZ6_9BACL|nr:beta-galactosidase GalA [Paenibacillus sp. SYP-B3998]NEW05769.1 glycoside hydrolase family 2 protein [Paenibacillus sp. SYP-B3998]